MEEILSFKHPQMILGKEDRVNIEEIKVDANEIHAIHQTEDGKYVLAIKVHSPKESMLQIKPCYAFHISKEDYEMAKLIFTKKGGA